MAGLLGFALVALNLGVVWLVFDQQHQLAAERRALVEQQTLIAAERGEVEAKRKLLAGQFQDAGDIAARIRQIEADRQIAEEKLRGTQEVLRERGAALAQLDAAMREREAALRQRQEAEAARDQAVRDRQVAEEQTGRGRNELRDLGRAIEVARAEAQRADDARTRAEAVRKSAEDQAKTAELRRDQAPVRFHHRHPSDYRRGVRDPSRSGELAQS